MKLLYTLLATTKHILYGGVYSPPIILTRTNMKTYQFTNRHGRKIEAGEEQAILLYGNPSMRFDGELITEEKQVKAKNSDGTYQTKQALNKDGSPKKDTKGNFKTEYVYTTKLVNRLVPENTPESLNADYSKNRKNVIELKSVMGKNGKESSKKSFLNNKSIR